MCWTELCWDSSAELEEMTAWAVPIEQLGGIGLSLKAATLLHAATRDADADAAAAAMLRA